MRISRLLRPKLPASVLSRLICSPLGDTTYLSVYLPMALQSLLLDLGLFFSLLILYTAGRTPRTEDQPVARPLPTHRINAHTDIHALSGILTHDPSVRASEDSSCLRPRGHCDRHKETL
jgi:hypothetical protein